MSPLQHVIADDVAHILAHTPRLAELADKTVLVTGGAGMLLAEAVLALSTVQQRSARGGRLLLVVRDSARARARLAALGGDVHAEFIQSSLDLPLDIAGDVDVIIHGAGHGDPKQYKNDWRPTVLANVQGTMYLLDLAKRKGTRQFIFISSGAIYGYNGETERVDEDFRGSLAGVTMDVYGNSKSIAEWLCATAHAQDGLDVRILRPAHFYGPTCQIASDTRVVADFLRATLEHRPIVLRSAGLDKRSFGYVADFATALFHVLFFGASGEAYNVGNDGEYMSIGALAERFHETFGSVVRYEPPPGAPRAQAMLMSSAKLGRLGWRPGYGLQAGLERSLEALSGNVSHKVLALAQ